MRDRNYSFITMTLTKIIRTTPILLIAQLFSTITAFVPLHHRSHATTAPLAATTDDTNFHADLRQRIGAGPFAGMLPTTTETKPVYYILKLTHGVHSIEYPHGSGNNVVLAFTQATGCRKFAATLKEQEFFDPEVSFLFVGGSGLVLV